MRKIVGRPQASWLVAGVVASLLLAATLLVPLWKMELVARQYPEGLVMYAYGYKFTEDETSVYDDIREINGLNHYIGMDPIEEVTEMQLFIPGVIALILGTLVASVVVWKQRWLKWAVLAGFWTMPIFFVADLQFWLYRFGHTLDEKAPLDTGSFTPKVIGKTEVWNFHSETSFDTGFYLMIAAALVITFLPPVIEIITRRIGPRPSYNESPAPLVRSSRAERAGQL